MKKIVFLLMAFVMFSCNQNTSKKSDDGESPFVSGGAYSQELSEELKDFQEQEEKDRKEREANLTDVEFAEMSWDFGDVKVNSRNVHYYKLTNTGKKPLVVESVQASCGCTTPNKLDHPIPPGGTDSIKVEFVPYEGMSGSQEKVVTVKSNTIVGVNKLILTANVISE